MQRLPFQLKSDNGTIHGMYCDAGKQSPLVIIANGHNGFYNYGMFPSIQQYLVTKGISSIAFNYTHSGIIGEADFFEDLERYSKNCRRLEKEDLLVVLKQVPTSFPNHSGSFILAHSMGGIATVFAAKEATTQAIPLQGIILLNCLSTLDVRSEIILENWKKERVWLIRNNRTQQDLPQGEEYLEETLASRGNGKWNPAPIVRSLLLPILIVHTELDESVPIKHGEQLAEWTKDNHPKTTFYRMTQGSHTLGTKHPFEGSTPALEEFLTETVNWINRIE